MNYTVLITNGTYFNALGITRLLGQKGIRVIVTADHEPCIAGVSRYCAKYYIVSTSNDDSMRSGYIDIVKKEKVDVILPIGYDSYKFFIYNKNSFSEFVKLPIIEPRNFLIAGNKYETFKFAKKIGIPVPNTYIIKNYEDLQKISSFPVVIKASEESLKACYANSYNELLETVSRNYNITTDAKNLPIIQDYISGDNGFGFYAFYWDGKLVSSYMHKRLHMYPHTGGPSTMAETFNDQVLYFLGKKILDKLEWHGVAMIEFKKDERTGKYYLIEINPKYWGSLELGLHAGYHLPYYHIMYSLGQAVSVKKDYTYTCFMWPETDLLYSLSGSKKILKIIKWILNLINFRIKKNWKISDLRPLLYELKYLTLNFKKVVYDRE